MLWLANVLVSVLPKLARGEVAGTDKQRRTFLEAHWTDQVLHFLLKVSRTIEKLWQCRMGSR